MRFRILGIAQGFALGAAVFAMDATTSPASAQAEPPALSVLIELAQNDAVDDILGVPGAQLGDVLMDGTDAERLALIAALPDSAVDSLLVSMLQAGASGAAIASVIEAVIVSDPGDTARIVEVVLENAVPAERPGIAGVLFDEIESLLSEDLLTVDEEILEGLVFAALTIDISTAEQFAQLGSSLDGEAAEMLAMVLARITETADPSLASAIETAIALEGGLFAQAFGAARDEVDVAVIPPADPAPVPVAPDAPAVAPAQIGGPGAAPADTPASAAGEDAIFAQGGGASGGAAIGGGPTRTPASDDDDDDDDDDPVTPPAPAPDPSPVD